MKLLGTVKEKGINTNLVTLTRTTARAIILKEDKILLVYSNMFHDFVTPGGGIKEKEELEEGLKREIREEIGGLMKKASPLGYIDEYRTVNGEVFCQKNYYFLVEIDHFIPPNRDTDEIIYGMEATWVTIDEAIKQNELEIKRRSNGEVHLVHPYTTLKRENMILDYIKEHVLWEDFILLKNIKI